VTARVDTADPDGLAERDDLAEPDDLVPPDGPAEPRGLADRDGRAQPRGPRGRPGQRRDRRQAPFDDARVQAAVRELLVAVGEDPDREGLLETPARVARAYAEVFAGLHTDPGDVLTNVFDEHHDELVIVKDIPFASTCEHHLVPFVGEAHLGYIPNAAGQVTGLSKLARLVDLYAKRPQVQERLTGQVADTLVERLQPRGVIVVLSAEHLCMTMRGVRKPGARTVTSAVRGLLRDSQTSRAEALSLIQAR
jgi:GTP cyclohydrolase I